MASPASISIEHRRTARWALCVLLVVCLRALGLRLPRPVVRWFARRPMQYRIAGGRWQTISLDPAELRRRFP